jgi:hypothetical protein
MLLTYWFLQVVFSLTITSGALTSWIFLSLRTHSTLSVITTISKNCFEILQMIYPKQQALKVFIKMKIIFFSNRGGLTWRVNHLWAYFVFSFIVFFSVLCKLIANSRFNLYFFIKVSTKLLLGYIKIHALIKSSNRGGLTWRADPCHLWAYFFYSFIVLFSILCKVVFDKSFNRITWLYQDPCIN